MTDTFISRRRFLAGTSMLLGAALTPIASKAFAAIANNNDNQFKMLMSPVQLNVAKQMADTIIPTTNTPGAAAAMVHDFINMMVSSYLTETERAMMLAGFDNHQAILSMTEQQRIDYVSNLDKNRHSDEFFKSFKELTVIGYYTSKIGASVELNYDPVPGPYKELPFKDVGKVWST
ncbi:gluconate 2-dehydrogenase subunit 3 family protein [Thalassotalea agarivorans]|uniref:Gluconate 2-dehydrogenase subunit 3 n=1 Tax=Thalassotalea agarivorans TaxID=349064 RepID=A0A1H9Y7I1_THASX|nr:gluconate 2-dehydrogenase subunit 3 family protein [Thalassotalea agarivorans]SES64769.1 Gluconate 2-dehydrogenase subunit 3 [Thalassotalea agarivorans]